MKITIIKLKQSIRSIITSSGYYNDEEAAKMMEVLLHAELTGKNTQGLIKLMGSEPIQEIKPIGKPTVIKETPQSVLIDGKGAAGPLGAQIAVDLLLKKMDDNGIVVAGLNNTFSSICALSHYAKRIAEQGYIGIVCASSPKAIIYPGTKDPIFGTNPIAFGFPTETYPIIFDAASSAMTWYGLVRAQARGEQLPEGFAFDENGDSTTDPIKAMEGGILPAGGYKGAGFGLVVELLAGPLVGASYAHLDGDWGSLFIALDPDLLVEKNEFKKHATTLVEKIKALRVKEGQSIHVPGFDNEEVLATITSESLIDIDDAVATHLKLAP